MEVKEKDNLVNFNGQMKEIRDKWFKKMDTGTQSPRKIK